MRAVSRDGRSKAKNVLSTYQEVLEESFTPREQRILEDAGIRLIVENIDRDGMTAGGRYIGMKNGKHTICMDDSKPLDKETMVHETIHILQEIDPQRPKIETEICCSAEMVNLKEALTEAETIARIPNVDSRNIGYYADLTENKTTKNKTEYQMKRSDHDMFRKDKFVAENIVDNVHENFMRSNIQYLNAYGNKTARATWLQLQKEKRERYRRK